jgi:hypothetical protein
VLDQERVRKLRLQNNETEERLIDTESHLRSWAAGMGRIRDRLVTVPSEVEDLLPAEVRKTARGGLDAIIGQLLREMASLSPSGD